MIWSLFGKDAQCCNYIRHRDGYSCVPSSPARTSSSSSRLLTPRARARRLYYPDGGSQADSANALAVVQHWARLQGKVIPTTLPAVACPQPAF